MESHGLITVWITDEYDHCNIFKGDYTATKFD